MSDNALPAELLRTPRLDAPASNTREANAHIKVVMLPGNRFTSTISLQTDGECPMSVMAATALNQALAEQITKNKIPRHHWDAMIGAALRETADAMKQTIASAVANFTPAVST